MDSDSKLVVEVWDIVRDLIPSARREDAVLKLLKVFEEYGVDISPDALEGEDTYLDAALENYREHADEDDDSEDDE
jgi:hypothetical protein